MKSQVKQLTPVETFKPITLEIQIETLDELKILRGLCGANHSVASAVINNASYMSGIDITKAATVIAGTFNPLDIYFESL